MLGLLAVFEFINLFIHPYLAHVTNDSPVLMLGVLIAIGALLIPLHHKLEKWITKIMVEKNKKIRLDATKKTIASLEGENKSQIAQPFILRMICLVPAIPFTGEIQNGNYT